jgi:hypothetical protein
MAESARRGANVAKVFEGQPERLATAWRRVRFSEAGKQGPPRNQLDGVVEPFIRELGRSLAEQQGSPWSRTQAVLRLAPGRGLRALREEFSTLRRCLLDAVEALGGSVEELRWVNGAVEEAEESAVALMERMGNRAAPQPRVPFAGVVVQFFDRPEASLRSSAEEGRAAVH